MNQTTDVIKLLARVFLFILLTLPMAACTSQATPTLGPTATPTLEPALTATPVPTPTPMATSTLAPTPTPTPTAEDHFDTAMDFEAQERFEDAIAALDKAIHLDSSFDSAYYHRGKMYGKLGQYVWAIQDFNQAVKLAPDSPRLTAVYA